MSRDVTKEEQAALMAEAEKKGWLIGYRKSMTIAQAEKDTRQDEIFEQGRRYQREQTRKVEWARLFTYQVMTSVIGCGTILAMAIGLSNLPH